MNSIFRLVLLRKIMSKKHLGMWQIVMHRIVSTLDEDDASYAD